MQELKIQCDCGQRYKFDVEPVNNRMPFKVNCPSCGLDGTEKANVMLGEQNSEPILVIEPEPVAAAPAAPAPSGLRLSSSAAPAAHAAPPPAPPMTPPGPSAPPPRRFVPGANLPKAKTPAAERSANIPLGILGAVLGGFIGMMGWFLLIKATGYAIGYAAVGVGFLAGLGARMLGRAGSPVLGAVAATCAAVAILGGQYMFAADFIKTKLGPLAAMLEGVGENLEKAAASAYDDKAKAAPDALTAETDDQIKAVYEKLYGMKPDAEELTEFKGKELLELKDIANGKLTKQQYVKKEMAGVKGFSDSKGLSFRLRWEMFKATVDVITILFLLLGISTAFKIGNG